MGDDVGVEAFIRQQDGRHRPAGFAGPTLAWIKCPTLVLTGDQDNHHPERALDGDGQRQFPVRNSWLLPNCGHMPQPEQPQATAEALTEWLREFRPLV